MTTKRAKARMLEALEEARDRAWDELQKGK
jgi:hypothetical protein